MKEQSTDAVSDEDNYIETDSVSIEMKEQNHAS